MVICLGETGCDKQADLLSLDNLQQFNLEQKRRVSRDPRRSLWTVCQIGGTGDPALATHLDVLQGFGPARNHPGQRKGCGFASVHRAVEHRAVTERPVVCAGQRVAQEGSSPSGALMESTVSKSGGNASLAVACGLRGGGQGVHREVESEGYEEQYRAVIEGAIP